MEGRTKTYQQMIFCLLINLISFTSFAEGAINPRVQLRVKQIKIGEYLSEFGLITKEWKDILRIEEPASALFCFITACVCINGFFQYRKLQKENPKLNYPFHWMWYLFLLFFSWTYLWSTYFHIYETVLNERMDYLCAIIAWGNQVYSGLILGFRIEKITYIILLSLPFLFRSSYFVYYMLNVKFDYGYAVKVVTVYLVLHAIVWNCWAIYEIAKKKRYYSSLVIFAHFLVGFFIIFELVDFIPIWGIFDGHSLWHLGHIPMLYCWVRLSQRDFLQYKLDHEKNHSD